MTSSGRRFLTWTVAAVAVVLLVGRWLAYLYAESLWYDSLGAGEVWNARLVTVSVLTVGSFLVASLFLFANLYAVRQSVVSLVLPRRVGNIEISEEVSGRYLLAAAALLSAIAGALLVLPTNRWHVALLAMMGRPFGESDPYFGADLGFFVYWLPFETSLHLWSIVVLTTTVAIVVLLYALTPSLRWVRGTLYVSPYVRRHFVILGAVVMLVLAWSYRLGMYRLLASGGGEGGAFTMVDHRVLVPAMLLLSIITLCAAIVVAWAGWSGQMRLAFFAVSVVLLLSLVTRTIAPLAVRRSSDPSARLLQEAHYHATRLTYTRRAFAVDRMVAESIGTGFASAAEAAPRIAVWDAATLERAAERSRRVHVVGDGATYRLGSDGLAALFVEHGTETTPDGRDVWEIGRFDAAGADERGMPVRASGITGDEYFPEPAVYDSAATYSVLSDSLRQLAGVELGSTRSRLVHSWALQNFRLLFGTLPGNRPTMVRRRDVRTRVAALVPFFTQGSEVVPVVAGDSLYWALELYATSSTYPLSQRFTALGRERAYLHHAATAIVHAASGRVRIVASATPEPVTQSWIAYFPRLFAPLSSLEPALRIALPPITDGARTQALAFAVAGFRGDTLEVRHFAAPDGADSAAAREPTWSGMPSLGAVTASWPLLDSTERVRGVVAAIGGATRVTAWVPVASDGQRWGNVVDHLRMTDTASHDAGAVRTPVKVGVVAGKPLYVQATFRWRPGLAPVLARVAAVMGDSAHIGSSLDAALGAPAHLRRTEPARPTEMRARADSLYRVVRDALTRGDWATFGRAFDSLGVTLRGATP